MTITFALLRAFVGSFLVGMGIGVCLAALNRLIRAILNAQD